MRLFRTIQAPLVALCVAFVGLVATSAAAAADESGIQPLERAHAHNDYEHARPLLDALSHGFTSVEADVWLVDGELYIGHDGPDFTRTLESTYLRPLHRIVRTNGGAVYDGWGGSLRLLIDVKSDGTSTWPVIEDELEDYAGIMTRWNKGKERSGAVTAVISGNRDLPAMQAAKLRFSGYDGRLSDLDSGLPSTLMPLVSDNWTRHFTWLGVGPMPDAERAKLHDIVSRAHAAGYDVRFWATPDMAGDARLAIWRELVAADVDAINTDDLAGLQEFLLAEDPAESQASRHGIDVAA
jgi:hypothetical protein